jgi:hypothetical protein
MPGLLLQCYTEILYGTFSWSMLSCNREHGKKMSEACETVGKRIASQNDLLVIEHELREREGVIAGYVKEVERLKGENKRLRESSRIQDEVR